VPCLDEVLYVYDYKLSHESLTVTVCCNVTLEIIVYLCCLYKNIHIRHSEFFISLHTDLFKFSVAPGALQNEIHMGQL
jgi:hypothetical protein